MKWLAWIAGKLFNLLARLVPLKRRALRHGDGDLDTTRIAVDLAGGPLKPGHRRLALRDRRLLPKHDRRNPFVKPPRVFQATEAARLFAPTLRTRDPNLRTLATDEEQLARYGLPTWKNEGDVAQGLGVSIGTLRHFSIHRSRERVPHYFHFALPKRRGGERLICAPKARLKAVQRSLLREVVERLPVHSAAHGFVRGRSVGSCAAQHVGKAIVVRLDLEDFFGTITFPRVRGMLIAFGYGYEVASVLAVLMTEAPRQPVELDGELVHVPVGPRHCVQGAPTSPGLSNAILMRMDRRLRGLARAFGYAYSRYADDLTFSGDEVGRVGELLRLVSKIVNEEGFRLRRDKTRVLRRGSHQSVCGVTVNETLGLSRKKRRRLRAMIHAEQRRRGEGNTDAAEAARIEGWLAYLEMLNPEQAAPLKRSWELGKRPYEKRSSV